ncbi:MAG: HNH endonuclease [Proteobacteria bacterium]|nr:MAG: HNH endonuclease [Pseudomonadota bacterium]
MDENIRYGQLWTFEEITLALYLYCQIPFKKTVARNPPVQALANHLGRTPASVARKLGNLGALDPSLAKRNITGLVNMSKTDREVWDRYSSDWTALVDDAVKLWTGILEITDLSHTPVALQPEQLDLVLPTGPSQVVRLTNVRLHQAFFRRTVLASYDDSCCACGIDVPSLLTASHIVPWAKSDFLRTDPRNGLCLCALHDRAFDRGLLTVSEEGNLLASELLHKFKSEANHDYLLKFHGVPFRLPQRFAPNPDHLAWHRENIFQRILPA